MNRRTLILGASALGVAAFAGGAFVLKQRRDALRVGAIDTEPALHARHRRVAQILLLAPPQQVVRIRQKAAAAE